MKKNSVFISYSRKNEDFATQLEKRLKDDGREFWIDQLELLKAEEWWAAISQGILSFDVFVAVLSPTYIASPICNLEMLQARLLNKKFVPIMYRDITKEQLDLSELELGDYTTTLIAKFNHGSLQEIAVKNLQRIHELNWIFTADEQQLDNEYENLDKTLDIDIPYIKEHTKLLNRANEWDVGKRNDSALLRGEELHQANEWLIKAEGKTPQPTELQTIFITQSNLLEKRTFRRNVGIAIAVATIVVFLGVFWLLESQRASAEERLKTIARALDARTRASNLYLIGEFQSSESAYLDALKILQQLEPTNTNNHWTITGDFQGAKYAFENNLEPSRQLKSDDPNAQWAIFATNEYVDQGVQIEEWLTNLAQACAQLRDYKCAETYLNFALGAKPDNLDAYLLLADVYREEGHLPEATAAFNQAVNLSQLIKPSTDGDPTKVQVDRMRGKLKLSSKNPKDINDGITNLMAYFSALSPSSNEILDSSLSPYYLELAYYIGRGFKDLEKPDEACRVWRKVEIVQLTSPPAFPLLWLKDMIAYMNTARKNCNS